MELLKSSIEKKKDDHEVFGSYVAMEMRNLKTTASKIKLRAEIRDAISRVVAEDSTNTNSDKTPPCFDETGSIEVLEKKDKSLKSNKSNESSKPNADVDNVFCNSSRSRNSSWDFIN